MGSMQGAGETTRPFWITLFALWGLRVPLAFICALPTGQPLFGSVVLPFGFGLGSSGAWLSMAITQGIQGVLSMLAFKQGHWKYKTV
jgi:Na+-driven multidrug efflux pump